jgi:VWFA-related protein
MTPKTNPTPRDRSALARRLSLAVSVGASLVASPAHGQQPPRFQSSVEVTSIDATVVDDRGHPVLNLQPRDFTVRVDGQARRVISAEWVPLTSPEGPRAPSAPEGYSSNENASGGRLILMVVDQPNIRFGAAAPLSAAIGNFLDRLEPADRVAAVALGQGGLATPFSADRTLVKQALARMSGRDRPASSPELHRLSVTEAAEIVEGRGPTIQRVVGRECLADSGPELTRCGVEIEQQATTMLRDAEFDAQQTLVSLGALLDGLKAIDLPKTLVLVSGGFYMRDQARVVELGSLAAAARTSIYVLKLDNRSADVTDPASRAGPSLDRFEDTVGLELLAASARGSLWNVVGSSTNAFERIQAELSGYYLLGVESAPTDKDGKAHPVRIEVGHRGATVRTRRQLTGRYEKGSQPPREAMMAALNSPLLVSALPIRVATFSLKGPEVSKIQLLIHADIGTDYAGSKMAALAYVIADRSGRIVDSQVLDARLPPVMNGVPSPLQFTGGASLEPGDYTLKLAVAEGDRVGTVEHPIHAALVEGRDATLSDLMVGGPLDAAPALRPVVGYRVSFGTVQAYVEAYGPTGHQLKVRYEIAPGPHDPALIDTAARGLAAGDERTIFSSALAVRQLPPGKYYLRAVVDAADGSVETIARPFEIAAPAVLMTSAENTTSVVTMPGEVYLPVIDEMFARPFKREEASRGETLRAFRAAIAAEARATFDKGAALLDKGDYVKAEQSFKETIAISSESTTALAYLAATYAASGHDIEAANAWQTSLVDTSDFPQIYEWLGDTLLRTHQLTEARAVLEEATHRWPGNPRFALPMALVYAAFGQGREAVRSLERHLLFRRDDHIAQRLGVEWLYHLRAAGAVAHTVAEDLRLAKAWADAYIGSKGPQAALVRQWVQFLEHRESGSAR